jgi:hypothetical protein
MRHIIRVRRGVVHTKGRHHGTKEREMKVEQVATGIRHHEETNLERLRSSLEHMKLGGSSKDKYVYF